MFIQRTLRRFNYIYTQKLNQKKVEQSSFHLKILITNKEIIFLKINKRRREKPLSKRNVYIIDVYINNTKYYKTNVLKVI